MNNHIISKKSIFVVHNIKEVSAINLIEGNKSSFVCSDMDNFAEAINYSIKPIWKKQKTNNIVNVNEKDSLRSFYPYSLNKINILHLRNNQILNHYSVEKLKTDYIILSKNAEIRIEELSSYFEFEMIIFDSSNSFYKIRNWKNDCEKLGIKCHDVIEKGAYIRYL
jgi:competence protein ComEC